MFTASQSGCKVFDLCLKGSGVKVCVHVYTVSQQTDKITMRGKRKEKQENNYVKMQNNEIKNRRPSWFGK